MKLRVRMGVIAAIICLVPLLLGLLFTWGIAHLQAQDLAEKYNVTADELSLFKNPMAIYGRMAKADFLKDVEAIEQNTKLLEDKYWLADRNKELADKESFIIVRRGDSIAYTGNWEVTTHIQNELPKYGYAKNASSLGTYIAETGAVLVKQKDFRSSDGMNVSFFVVTDVNTMLPMWKSIAFQGVFAFIIIMMITAIVLLFWLYRGIVKPLAVLQAAANQIAEGNLNDSILGTHQKDEIGQLQLDFENMRIHLKEMSDAQIRQRESSRQMMSSVSHDLKTPLTAIKGYTEGLLDGVADTPEKQQKYLNIILSKANAMELLVEELHFFAKMDNDALNYDFKVIKFKDYMDDCCDELTEDMKTQGNDLIYEFLCRDDVKVILDPEHFRRVIDNVVGNAAKYMDKPRGRIRVVVTQEPGKVWVRVEDNGPGIRAENLEHIFERFYRGDKARSTKKGGSGLGLAIVKTIVEAHGGTIYAESEEGVGTTIGFSILQETASKPKQTTVDSE